MKGHRRSIFSSRNFNRNLLKDGVNDLSFPVGQYISILGLKVLEYFVEEEHDDCEFEHCLIFNVYMEKIL